MEEEIAVIGTGGPDREERASSRRTAKRMLDRDTVVNVTAIATSDASEVREDAGPRRLDPRQLVSTGLRLVLCTPFAG